MLKYFFILLLISFSFTQTTGKISGLVADKKTNDPLPGANIYLQGTVFGTASDVNGRFSIINIPPGKYSFKVDMIGYKSIVMNDISVSVNRTLSLTVDMDQTVIEGEVVVVEVDRAAQKKDQTGTIKNISGDDINSLPVESVGSVINMQAGVVNGHFRGGRTTEVTYMIDGVQVDETFGGSSATVDIQPEAVQDLEVITGTFNAEYGRAMSGVVNVVTKDGGSNFEGSSSFGFSTFQTKNTDIFIGLDPSINNSQDLKFSFGGPILGEKLTFFTNVRYQKNKGHLNGLRIFSVNDISNFYSDDSSQWSSEKTGDSSYVPMNTGNNLSILGKLSFNFFEGIRISFLHSYSDDSWFGYDHGFKYNPDGRAGSYKETNYSALQFNHMISSNLFYEIKLSSVDNYYGNYLFKNPLQTDPSETDTTFNHNDSSYFVAQGYIHDKYFDSYGPGFLTGGQSKNHEIRKTVDQTAKFDLTWQVSHAHSFKTGFHFFQHEIDNQWRSIRNQYHNTSNDDLYAPEIFGDTSAYADVYKVSPKEIAFYLQDKMEYDDMVINAGIRYDSFDPNSRYPSDRRNPANQLILPDSMTSKYPDAPSIEQWSPRIGFAYQLGNEAVLHFSYGHFFQMPPMYAMYQNNSFLVDPNDYVTTMGNTLLEPEKTITYEIGLWQGLSRNVSLDVALFYRDIYNLLSTKIITTYNQVKYGLYSNKDYGNVRGLELKLDLGQGVLRGMVNYTLQYTRGNADSPTQSFSRAGASMDPVNRFIPMSWDQRHTLNGSMIFSMKNYGATLTAYYNSGSPYTFVPQSESVLSRINLYPNNDYRPEKYSVDGAFYYRFKLFGIYNANLEMNIYNILDRLNEEWVDSQTGRAYTAVIKETDLAGHRSDFNKYEDRIQNPSMYSSPRSLKIALGIYF